MIKMVVIRDRKVRYPRGASAREYSKGQEFEVLSERDAKAFTLLRVAKVVESAAKPAPKPTATRAMKAETPFAAITEDDPPRQYRRRDMTPEE